MSKVLIKSSTLTDIANAIRAKDGSTAQMYPSEMAMKIQGISTGEKRIIPTKMVISNSDKTLSGKGILYHSFGAYRATIDGTQYTIPYEIQGGSFYETEHLVPIKFNASAIVGEYSVGIVGYESDVILDNIPTQLIQGSPNPSTSITATGHGYVIVSTNSTYRNIGAITIDGVKIFAGGIYEEGSFRLDFDKNVTIKYSSSTSSQAYYEIYIF